MCSSACLACMCKHLRFAKWRYGARVIVHRGSRHILSQRDILAQSLAHAPGAQQVTPFAVRRELNSYAVADRIAVPSTQVVDSFCPIARTCLVSCF